MSSLEGVSEGEPRCIVLWPLRPCELELRLCFLLFLSFADELEMDSVELPAAVSPLFTAPELSLPTPVDVEAPPRLGTALDDVSRLELLSGSACGDFFAFVSAEPGVELLAGLLLGRLLFEDDAFEELPGSALLFWSAGIVAVPLSSVVWLFGVDVVLVSRVPVPVLVCARAPDALSASANAAVAMSFIEPPWLVSEIWRRAYVDPTNESTAARSAEREEAARPLPLMSFDEPGDQAENDEPHPQVCLALGFLKLKPLCPNWPST